MLTVIKCEGVVKVMLMIIPFVIVYFLVAIVVISLCNAAGKADSSFLKKLK